VGNARVTIVSPADGRLKEEEGIMRKLILRLGALTLMLVNPRMAEAGPVFSTGSESAVITVDRIATFDSLTIPNNGSSIANYTEDGLSISVPVLGAAYGVGFDPFNDGTTSQFYYISGGANTFVTIRGVDNALMSGLEFKLGTGEPGLATSLLWETLKNGIETGSGSITSIEKGTVVGWSDSLGFDELQVAANNFNVEPIIGFNAIALDDLKVQLLVATVPEPVTLTLLGIGIAGMAGYGWRRRKLAAAWFFPSLEPPTATLRGGRFVAVV
jgi:hypothetical protein